MFTLRDYQSEALDAIRFGHQEHDSVCVEMATGLGKTVLFTRYAAQWNQYAAERRRCMVIAPQIPLIGQAARKIQKETGEQPAIEQASEWSNEEQYCRSDFVVASKQSLCSGKRDKRYQRFEDIGLVIADECHYAATEQYADMLHHFTDRGAKILGVSATLKRHDKRAMGQLFDECCYTYGIQDAIAEGWLVPLRVTTKQLEKLNLDGVDTSQTFFGKDFNQKHLNEKLENPEVIYEIAEAVAAETRGEKTAIFCSSVEEARAVAELLVDQHKIAASWICADTSKCSVVDRAERMRSFESAGGITHMANVGILTTGWDFPALKNIVMARPTKSRPLYTQIIGRVTRPIEGSNGAPVVDFEGSQSITRHDAIRTSSKPYGRVIDLVDNSLKHKLVTCADILGGRWSLGNDEDSQYTCRFCLESFSSSRMLGVHMQDTHPEEMLAAQQASEEDLAEQREAAHEALRQQRAARRAEATFVSRRVDPFGEQQGQSRGRKATAVATQKQLRYLWVLGFKNVDNYQISKRQASRLISQLRDGLAMEDVMKTNRLSHK